MKKRIKIDSTLLSFIIIMTGFLFTFRGLYSRNPLLDDTLDFVGFMVLLAGILLRMSARGHKKAHSDKSQKLVVTGPYTLIRNPMYLGSFLMGAGFILMVWPWWSLPIFGALFYVRFKKEVVKEEKYLAKLAKEEYEAYCARVPRIFPSLKQWRQAKINEVINLEEAFSTKEQRGLWGWPVLAVLLESFQEQLIFEETLPSHTIMIFLMAAVVFVAGFAYLRQRK
ncbi:MAG TPA: isoprenylcysteine carboxylmethyltransferase family protein [Candidatus Omnitrophota bacterium]|nr:isoprenylcysteine carboxylmethyltransferase family protein [Candidatus Omnitrophota bacterium]